MATRHLTRALLLSRSYSSSAVRPIAAAADSAAYLRRFAPATSARWRGTPRKKTTRVEAQEKWLASLPQEPVLPDGRDMEHWHVMMEVQYLDPPPTTDEIIDLYVKTLALVMESEEEARMKIYSVYTDPKNLGFGALVSEKVANFIEALPKVDDVMPDSYDDREKKCYGGVPFINGQAVPHDPKS